MGYPLVNRARWIELRGEVLARAHGRCEHCGRADGDRALVFECGCWNLPGATYRLEGGHAGCALAQAHGAGHEKGDPGRFERTQLVILHGNLDQRDEDVTNLVAVCESCARRAEERRGCA